MPVVFNNPPVLDTLENDQGRQIYLLVEPLVANVVRGKRSVPTADYDPEDVVATLVVPADFRTDFASVPPVLWFIFPPWGRYTRAAILHDYLYTQYDVCSRFFADAIFREAMASLGVPYWKRLAAYYAVRLLGWTRWKD